MSGARSPLPQAGSRRSRWTAAKLFRWSTRAGLPPQRPISSFFHYFTGQGRPSGRGRAAIAEGSAFENNQREIKCAAADAKVPEGSKHRATVEQKATLEELARSHTDTALGILVQVAQSGESEGARVSADNAILDRGYGKPPQAVQHGGEDGGPIEHHVTLTGRDLARRIALWAPLLVVQVRLRFDMALPPLLLIAIMLHDVAPNPLVVKPSKKTPAGEGRVRECAWWWLRALRAHEPFRL